MTNPSIDSGVPHGRALLEFATAVVDGDDSNLERTREAIRAEMGDAGVADAAAVASNFERMVRIADSIGIELGDWMESMTEEVRTELGLDRLRNGPEEFRKPETGPSVS